MTEAPRSTAGRGEARRQAMLLAATELFLERGFAETSVGDVVKRSGGSLATLYAWFGSKEGLFEAIVGEMSAQMLGGLDAPGIADKPLDEALCEFAERFLAVALCPESLRWQRMCMAEAHKFPALRAALMRSGPGYVSNRLGQYLSAQAGAGRLRIADASIAAMHFFALIKSESHVAAVCGDAIALEHDQLRGQVRRAVDVFLRGYGVRESPLSPGRPRGSAARNSRS